MTNPEFRDIDCDTEFCDTRYEGTGLANLVSAWRLKNPRLWDSSTSQLATALRFRLPNDQNTALPQGAHYPHGRSYHGFGRLKKRILVSEKTSSCEVPG